MMSPCAAGNESHRAGLNRPGHARPDLDDNEIGLEGRQGWRADNRRGAGGADGRWRRVVHDERSSEACFEIDLSLIAARDALRHHADEHPIRQICGTEDLIVIMDATEKADLCRQLWRA